MGWFNRLSAEDRAVQDSVRNELYTLRGFAEENGHDHFDFEMAIQSQDWKAYRSGEADDVNDWIAGNEAARAWPYEATDVDRGSDGGFDDSDLDGGWT